MNLDIIKQQKSELFKLVKDYFNDEKKAEIWFSTNNPNLGGISPDFLIFMGRADRLKQFIINSLEENK